ncbi:hypothetical protein [Merismopedia glauca]|uniref:DUF1152 domain-containing protein n=1 Tax=Merismopedia glauca CCAP 1448/3 TaxID=1296344 RepID=A0A2T1C9D5_9CYAN|nr:hypothetical protein [Merismopedia glauca]PSB04859.1 hypothetical protein C7B64_01860 [Merismopedia glauca CCAP 1448/3]
MQLRNLPLFDELKPAQNILLAGAGGGFDIFCGLPLYFALKALGKNVYLANLSFSYLPEIEPRLSPSLSKVTADTPLSNTYFPGKYLSDWFRKQGEEVPIYCFERTGFKPLLASYQALVKELSILAGNYGDYHVTPRTQGSKLWINPLMSLYWCFRFSEVAREIVYLEGIKQTETFTDVLFLMEGVQSRINHLRRWENIPI